MSQGLNLFAVDTAAEEEGVWVDAYGMEFLIAKVGNDRWKALQKKLNKRAYGSFSRKKDKQDDEKNVEIMVECLARTCVLDWKKVTLDGKDVKFSEDKCLEIVKDKRFRLLTEFLLDAAMDEARFMEEEIEEDEEKAKK